MKRTAVAAAAVVSASVLLAMTGCASGHPGAAGATAAAAGHAARTYTETDLKSVVTAAQASLGWTGGVTTTSAAQARNALQHPAGDPSSGKTTYSPAACGALITKAASSAMPDGTIVASTSNAGNTSGGIVTLSVAAISGKDLPGSIKIGLKTGVSTALTACSSFKESFTTAGTTTTFEVKLTKLQASTNGDTTQAFEISTTAPGLPKAVIADYVYAVDGNLLIDASALGSSGTTSSNISTLTGAVNAAIAAGAN